MHSLGWALTFILVSTFSLQGCATFSSQPSTPSSHALLLSATPNEAWRAINAVLGEAPVRFEDLNQGLLKTDWIEGEIDRPFGIGIARGNWKQRLRMSVQLEPVGEKQTRVTIDTQVEERPPGGRQALRWERVASDGSTERDFLKRLQAELNPSNV